MTSKDVAAVAKEVVDAFGIFNNPEGIAHFMRGPVRVSIEKALKAHGEAEYARGLEDAARIVIDHQQRYLEQRSTSDSAALLPVKKDILALKPKEDGFTVIELMVYLFLLSVLLFVLAGGSYVVVHFLAKVW